MLSKDALVSVVIRTTGREELADALDSVAAQAYPAIEVLLVDVEGYGSLAAAPSCGQLPVRVVSTGQHLGRGAAANAGLDAALGDYVVFLDDDDWFLPDHVHSLVSAVSDTEGVRAAYSGVECRRRNDAGGWEVLHVFNEPYDATRLLVENYLPMHAVLFDRRLLGAHLRFDESFRVYEDWDFWIQLSALTPLARVGRVTAVYRISEDSGFGIRNGDPEAGPGYSALLEKWRTRWSSEQLIDIAGYAGHRVREATAGARRELEAQAATVASLRNRIAELEQAVAARQAHAGDLQLELTSARERERNISELKNQVLHKLNGIQTSAAGQLARPFHAAESRWPNLVRGIALLPKLAWWTLTLRLRQRLRVRRLANELQATGLFDRIWYVENNPDVVLSGHNPIFHWLASGWTEGRNPNPLFDCDWYLAENPEVAAAGTNPLAHYLASGAAAGRDPNPLFDSDWYLAENPQVAAAGTNPLAHYLASGAAAGRDPNPLFDSDWYLAENPQVAAAGTNPLAHYLASGAAAGRDPNPLFDSDWYLAENPEVAAAGTNPLAHYLASGAAAGRDPNPLFDSDWYLAENPEVAAAGTNPLAHYLASGAAAGRDPNPLFDSDWYLAENPEVAAAGTNPLAHYLASGAAATGSWWYLRFLPPAAPEQIYLDNLLASEWPDYAEWLRLRAVPDVASWRALREESLAWRRPPLISVVTPAYNTDPAQLEECLNSVRTQSYPFWQFCVVDDGSSRPEVWLAVAEWGQRDPRIQVRRLDQNGGTCIASNAAIAMATGDYVAFLDHDDVLAPDALHRLAEAIRCDPEGDVFYSDRDMLSRNGRRFMHLLKPAWSPETLLSGNYLFHLTTYRRTLLDKLGGLRPRYEGSHDYDLILRAAEVTDRIRHIPRVLYHWRDYPGSIASDDRAKDYVFEAGKAALADALRRRDLPDRVTDVEHLWPGNYRGYPPKPNAGESLVLHVPEGLPPASYADWLREEIQRGNQPFIVILGVSLAGSEADAVGELLSWLALPGVGLATGRVVTPCDRLVHAGLVHRTNGLPLALYAGHPKDDPGYMSMTAILRNVSAPHPWCCTVRREVWDALDGFSENLHGPHAMLDLALRALASGWRTVYVPYAEFVTTAEDLFKEPWLAGEEEAFASAWERWLERGDPYYPVGMSLDRVDVALADILVLSPAVR